MLSKAELEKRAQEQEDARLEAKRKRFQPPMVSNAQMPIQETVHADDDVMDTILMAYKKKFSQEPWYKEPQVNQDGHLQLSFKDPKEAEIFFEEQAKAGLVFIVVDAQTKQVLGYSDGNGAFNKNTDNKSLEDLKAELSLQSNRPQM